MAFVVKDRVKETTTSTGTGAVILAGAAAGFQSFSAIGNSNTTFYCIAGQSSSEWEVGIGTYTSSGTTLSRDTVLSSSNSGALVPFSAGAKDVFVTYPAGKSAFSTVNTSESTISTPFSLGTNNNGFSVGPVTITTGGSVQVSGGMEWVVYGAIGSQSLTPNTQTARFASLGVGTDPTSTVGEIVATDIVLSGSSSIAAVKLPNIKEVCTISATAATGTIAYDVTTQSVLYYTSNASANWTVNFRGSSGTSLNNLMATGESMTVVFLVTQGSPAYYNNAIQVDGVSVTPKYQGGTAWSSGNANSIDLYSYRIVKTAASTFTVFASQTRFA
jgi:hypothetical protein